MGKDPATTPPDSMALACLFRGTGKALELEPVPIPHPGPQEAVVTVECCTLCGSDLHTVSGRRSAATPLILGHEILGRIVSVGPGLRDHRGRPLQIGDRVTWSICVSCGECFFCRAGIPQKCKSLLKYGSTFFSQLLLFICERVNA